MEPRSPNDHPTFGDLLRRHRLASGLAQEQLADQSGVSVRGISDLERGLRQAPRRSTVQLLTRALDLSPGDSAELHLVSRRAAALQRQEASTSRSNGLDPLPAPVDQFIGRANEIETITSLLHESPARLVTITGPGGVGKTRLALEVARRLAGSGSHRVAFVSLAQLTDHRSVLPAIAQMFGVTGGDAASLMRRLVAGVAGARHLLVLDNFEHLLRAAPVVVELLERCSNVQVLVTSRAALGVAGERRFPLEPMPVPAERDPNRAQSIQELSEVDSVRLFVERARSANTAFDLDERNTVAIGEICRHLEGLPLAIELAAARTGALNAPALLQSLQPRLPQLTSGYRNRPERLQTMRNAVAWSFELLSPEEQNLFCRLGVFEGGFGLDSAAALMVSTQSVAELLGQITSLVDQSLVRSQQSADGSPRFRMLETIREFALEQLDQRGDTGETRRAHAGVFLALAEELRPHLEGASGATALGRLEAEHGNLLASLSFFTEWEESEAALQLGGALWKFCFIHGHLSVGLDRLERALALPQTAYSDALAEALYGTGVLSRELGDLGKAREYGTELLEKAEAHDDSVHRAMAHFLL